MQSAAATSTIHRAGPAARLHAARRSSDRVAQAPGSGRRRPFTVQAAKDRQQEQVTGVTFKPFDEASLGQGSTAWRC